MRLKIFTIIIFSFLLAPAFMYGQSEDEIIRQLEAQLDKKPDPAMEVELCTELATLYLKKDKSKSYDYVKKMEKTLKRKDDLIDFPTQANAYHTIGIVYADKLDFKNAIDAYEKELVVLLTMEDYKAAFEAKFNIAALAFKTDQLSTANEYYEQLSNELEGSGNDDLQMLTYQALYTINIRLKNSEKALLYLQKFVAMSDDKFFDKASEVDVLSENYKVEKNIRIKTEKDLVHTENQLVKTENVLLVTDSTLQEVTNEKLMLENDTLKKSIEIQELELDKLRQEKEIEVQALINSKRQQTIYMLAGIIALILIGVLLVFFLYRRIKKQNGVLKSQKIEIETQRDEIKEKNNQITESIFYARRLQKAILVPETIIQQYLPQTFIYYKPRDIVSGDFYWFAKIENKFIISAIDCTGHGVPGAFLSMIGNTLLNKIVNENRLTSPAEILKELHLGMESALQQNSEDSETEDGMDMTLVTIIPDEKKFVVAAAKNSLIIVDNDMEKAEEVPSDFHSIGEKPLRPGYITTFKNHEFSYTNLTTIYMMTDGYTDQFGGKSGDEKFGSKKIKEILLENHLKSTESQKEILENTMNEWKKDNEQLDDMLIVGINLSDIAK
ncbi:MAG: SpoIIE family protein phosphatase [Bacteroidales bacterium]|nr:SpoIIE family protein phosphatase [Bacteroidales bacterium]